MELKHYKHYCKDIENVENYEMAAADNFKGWRCHHRLETHNSDGERRIVDIYRKELIALDIYWNRPASELIFLTIKEHRTLHNRSVEARRKLSEARKGKYPSEETRKKMSEAHKGKTNSTKGTHYYNNGKVNVRAKECPPGFVPGRIYHRKK